MEKKEMVKYFYEAVVSKNLLLFYKTISRKGDVALSIFH